MSLEKPERRCVFLDRDGVINVAPPPGDYITSPDSLVLLPNIADWIRLFRTLGFLVIVVTNQRCVSKGLISPEELDRIHQRMRDLLAAQGAGLDDIFCCPHASGTCDCRKPKPGMVFAARDKWSISLPGSVMIGDSENDRGLAENSGLSFVKVRGGRIEGIILGSALPLA